LDNIGANALLCLLSYSG